MFLNSNLHKNNSGDTIYIEFISGGLSMQLSDDKKYFIGIEGGATKSTGVVMDARGDVVYQFNGSAINYHATGEAVSTQNLKEIIDKLLGFISTQRGELQSAVFGLAGKDSQDDEEIYARIIRSLLGDNIVRRIVNDAVVNMHARCEGPCSIVVISGTGSNVYGECGDLSWFGGGQGHLASDEGSGYDAGNRVIHAAVSSWLERIPYTLLQNGACQQAGVKSIPELIARQREVFRNESEYYKSWVASFSRVLDNAIVQNDFKAKEIRDVIATELAKGVFAVFHHCRMERQKVCISLVGSNFKMPELTDLVQKKILERVTRGYFSISNDSGAVGAARMALKLDSKIILPHD